MSRFRVVSAVALRVSPVARRMLAGVLLLTVILAGTGRWPAASAVGTDGSVSAVGTLGRICHSHGPADVPTGTDHECCPWCVSSAAAFASPAVAFTVERAATIVAIRPVLSPRTIRLASGRTPRWPQGPPA